MRKLFLLVVLAGMVGMVYGLNPDAFQISCTPSVNYSVQISTPAAGLAFSAVAVGTTYVNSSTATITNNGDVTADWKIKATALNTWTLGATPAQNVARLLGALKSTLAVTGDFDTALDLLTTGEENMNATKYTVDQTGGDVAKTTNRLLSIRLDSPTDTTVDVEQKFRVEVKAYPSGTF